MSIQILALCNQRTTARKRSLLESAVQARATEQHPHPPLDFSPSEVCCRKKSNSHLRKSRVPDPRERGACGPPPGELAPSAARFVLQQSDEPVERCPRVVVPPTACRPSALNN